MHRYRKTSRVPRKQVRHSEKAGSTRAQTPPAPASARAGTASRDRRRREPGGGRPDRERRRRGAASGALRKEAFGLQQDDGNQDRVGYRSGHRGQQHGVEALEQSEDQGGQERAAHAAQTSDDDGVEREQEV